MCIRESNSDWANVQETLRENDIVKLSSLVELAESEEQLMERLTLCKEKNVTICICDSYLNAEVYMGILALMKQMDKHKKQLVYEAQRKGIQQALQKKKEGKGGYGRPRVELPEDFAERVKECIRNDRPLEEYRRQTKLKNSTFYKYAHMVKKEITYV